MHHGTGRFVPHALWLLFAAFAASAALVAPSPAAAVIGNCTPDAAWGTPDTTFAAQVVTLVNQHRQAMGLPALGVSATLTASARWKSAHMAYYRYMQHDDPAPPVARTVSDRLTACGYPITNVAWGENIAYGYQTPQDVMNAWLNSSGHKANIENPSFRAIGVGAVRSASGLWYWTQDFGSVLDSGSTSPPPSASAPTVSLTSAPATSTTSTSAWFGWTTTGSPTSVTCSLDGGAAVACSSPRSYSGLAVGSHRFVVTAANGAGSASATYSWTIGSSSTSAPTVRLTSFPVPHAWYSRFAWTTTGTVTSTTCSLDAAPPVSCASPTTYYYLAPGRHTFTVRVSNAAGWFSSTYAWLQ